MDKFVLKEIYHLRSEIKNLNDRINKKKELNPMAGDVVQNGYKRHAYIYGIDVTRKETIRKLYVKYNTKIKELDKLKLQVEEYIESIPFAELRNIFRFRYIDNMTWFQVANQMNKLYKVQNFTEDSVRCKHDRFIEKNNK